MNLYEYRTQTAAKPAPSTVKSALRTAYPMHAALVRPDQLRVAVTLSRGLRLTTESTTGGIYK